ncbi:MAG: hypothetical protein AAF804_18910, partial [Bacteroidota bacterium]
AAAFVLAIVERDTFLARPVYTIAGNRPGMLSDEIEALGLEMALVGINPETNLMNLQIRQLNPRADYVIIKAIAKPFINLLWLGTFILTAGFLISIYRRVQENLKQRKKG